MRGLTALIIASLTACPLAFAGAAETASPAACMTQSPLKAETYVSTLRCPTAAADILYETIHALRVKQDQPAYLTTTRVVTPTVLTAGQDAFFENATISQYRCFISSATSAAQSSLEDNAQQFTRDMPLSQLFQSECQAHDDHWQKKIGAHPQAARVANIILEQFKIISQRLFGLENFYSKMDSRYKGEYFKTADRQKNYISTINQLSTMAKELADATKPFFARVENLSDKRGENARWLEALDALILERDPKETSFEDYHALLVSILKNPLALTD